VRFRSLSFGVLSLHRCVSTAIKHHIRFAPASAAIPALRHLGVSTPRVTSETVVPFLFSILAAVGFVADWDPS
jgi:hypothetical protein